MQEEKFISEFWKSNERSNFSKEATVLFFYLIYIWKNENKPGNKRKSYEKRRNRSGT